MKNVPIAALLLVFCELFFLQSCASEPQTEAAYDMYRSAFSSHTEKMLTQMYKSNPEKIQATFGTTSVSELVEVMTECHMQALAEYSLPLQNSAYDAIASGLSYLEAKQSFDMALAAEGMAGGVREEEVKRMFAAAGGRGKKCLTELRDG